MLGDICTYVDIHNHRSDVDAVGESSVVRILDMSRECTSGVRSNIHLRWCHTKTSCRDIGHYLPTKWKIPLCI